jgi:hypothetical protein
VPVKVIETVGALIQAAGAVAKQQIKPDAAISGAPSLLSAVDGNPIRHYLKIQNVIEPGVYRLQKSWERAAATPTDGLGMDEVHGMFSDIGLEVIEVRSILDATQAGDEIYAIDARAQAAGATAPAPKPGS